jgi:hypothetical protein
MLVYDIALQELRNIGISLMDKRYLTNLNHINMGVKNHHEKA